MGHDHDHSAHSHAISADADRGKLRIALALIVGFMLVEVAIGIAASSLALLSDAGHMLTDAAAIAFSLAAISLAARPAKGSYTFGLKRTEILSAQINGITLLVLALLIVYEAIRRLIDPPDVTGGLVLAVALVGVVVNVLAAWVLSKANRQSLNVEGSFQHIVTDLYAFIATAIAGGVILTTQFDRADGIASLLVAALMLRSARGLLRESGRVFLEAAPRGIDPEEIRAAMLGARDVVAVHDLHVWEVTSGFPALSSHVFVCHGCDCHAVGAGLREMIATRFGIEHTTLQVDHADSGVPSGDSGCVGPAREPHAQRT